MVMWFQSADILFLQASIDHNMDVQYQRRTLWTKVAVSVNLVAGGWPPSCTTSVDSHEKFDSWRYPLLSYVGIRLRPSGRLSSAINSSLHLTPKYVGIFVLGYYLVRESKRFQRAYIEKQEFWGTKIMSKDKYPSIISRQMDWGSRKFSEEQSTLCVPFLEISLGWRITKK